MQDWQRTPDTIRRLLTHSLVPATDRKVIFVGLDAYTAAGGTVQRDLFNGDRGGWIADAALLERLVAEHLGQAAEAIRAAGWKRVEIGLQPLEACWRIRRIMAHEVPLSEADSARRNELTARYDALTEQHKARRSCRTRSRPNWSRSRRGSTRSALRSGSTARRRSPGPEPRSV